MNKSFIKSSAILFVGDLFTKILGFIYLAPLERIDPNIGAVQGYLMLPYSFFITFSVMGINNVMLYKLGPVKDDKDLTKKYFLDGAYYVGITSIAITLFLIIFANPMMTQFAEGLYYLDALIASLRIIAISIVFYAANMLIRSLLLSRNHVEMISAMYISEQIIKIVILLAGCYYFIVYKGEDIAYSAYISAWSVTISVASTTVLLLAYTFKIKIFDFLKGAKYKWEWISFKNIFMLGAVYFVNAVFINGFVQIDLTTFASSLTKIGYLTTEVETLVSIYFTWSWKLIMLVITLGSVFVTVMLQRVTSAQTNQGKIIELKAVFELVLMYACLGTIFFLTAGCDFYYLFYSAPETSAISNQTFILMAQSLMIVPFLLRMQLSSYAITVGKRRIVLLSTALIFGLKIILNPIFFAIFEYYGYIVASIVATLVSMIFMVRFDKATYQFHKVDLYKYLRIIRNMMIVLIISGNFTVIIRSFELGYLFNFLSISAIILVSFAVLNFKYLKLFMSLK